MKHITKPQVTATADAIDFSNFLTTLERSEASGVLRAEDSNGTHYEMRLVGGKLVRYVGPGDAADAVLALDADECAIFTMRTTRGLPNGEMSLGLSQVLMAAAFKVA